MNQQQQHQHSTIPLQSKYTSDSVNKNTLIFGICMLVFQTVICFIYIFTVNVPSQFINIGSVITTIGLAILVVAGFGLLFGYSGTLLWSSIGFSLFMTALCIEFYPLINNFWTRTNIQSLNNPNMDFTYGSGPYNIFLSNRETSTTNTTSFYGNCITNAIKCALACTIAFSGILGRAGPLQCFIVTIFGTIGFQLNRQVVQQNQGTDSFGTFYIFTFGGFMSLIIGFCEHLRQFNFRKGQQKQHQNQHFRKSLKRYISNQYSVLQSIFGSLIIFAFFPFLSYQIDAYTYFNNYSVYTNPLSLILAMGAGTIGAIIITLFINGQIIIRDVAHGPIAGAIAVGASTLYITNPTYSIVAGFAGGFAQSLIQNLIQKRFIRSKVVITTVSWSLFGVQGIIGSIFAWGWKDIFINNSNHMPVSYSVSTDFNSQYQFFTGLMCAGGGSVFGLLAGLVILLFVNRQKSQEYYNDGFYWVGNDGLTFEQVIQDTVASITSQNSEEIILQEGLKVVEAKIQSQDQGEVKEVKKVSSQWSKSSMMSKNIDNIMFFADLS